MTTDGANTDPSFSLESSASFLSSATRIERTLSTIVIFAVLSLNRPRFSSRVTEDDSTAVVLMTLSKCCLSNPTNTDTWTAPFMRLMQLSGVLCN